MNLAYLKFILDILYGFMVHHINMNNIKEYSEYKHKETQGKAGKHFHSLGVENTETQGRSNIPL